MNVIKNKYILKIFNTNNNKQYIKYIHIKIH